MRIAYSRIWPLVPLATSRHVSRRTSMILTTAPCVSASGGPPGTSGSPHGPSLCTKSHSLCTPIQRHMSAASMPARAVFSKYACGS